MMSRREHVNRQSDALVFALGRFVWPMHIVSAGLFVWLLRGDLAQTSLLAWAGWMIGFALVQAAICLRARRAWRTGTDFGRLPLAFDASVVLLAMAWGWLGFGLIPPGRFDLQEFAGFVIGGAVLTGAGTQNLHFRALAISISVILLPEATRMAIDHGWPRGGLAGSMLIVFLGLMLMLGWFLRRVTREGFGLQWDKAELARQLDAHAEGERAARREAEAANAAKSRFLAQASHDLRQPIHSMGLFLTALPRADLSARAREIIDRIDQSVDALSKLFNALLDVTLLDTGQTRPSPAAFCVGDMMAEVVDEHALAAEMAIVALRAEPSDLVVRTDPLILRRILQNLIANGLRHAEGSEIRLAARRTDDGVHIDVSDNGRGIATADRARIFEEFARTDGQGVDGLGLGLFIVRRLSEALGVAVALTSQEGRGARFSVGPFDPASAIDPMETMSTDSFADLPAGRVLVVDDDRATRESTAAILSGWGWTVEALADLPTARISRIEKPALVIADHDLGSGRTGLDVLAAMREVHGPVPAVVISGDSSAALRTRVEAAGLILLQKPVRPVQLRSAILGVIG